MYCTNCGAQLEDGTLFCTQCGCRADAQDDGANENGAATISASPLSAQPSVSTTQVATAAPVQPPLPATQTFAPRREASGGLAAQGFEPYANPVSVSPGKRRRRKSGAAVAGLTIAGLMAVTALSIVILHYFGVLGDPAFLRFLPTRADPAARTQSSGGAEGTSSPRSDLGTKAAVPNVTGMTQEQASSALRSAGFNVGTVTTKEGSGSAKGVVLTQAISGEAERGATIDLVVSAGRRVYTVVPGQMTWPDAEAYCEQHGGTLATVTSQEEWDQVLAAMRADGREVYWIGGRREIDGGNFTWVDGRTFSFTAWAAGEPNYQANKVGPENYLAVYKVNGQYGWYDDPYDLDPFYKASVMAFVMQTVE